MESNKIFAPIKGRVHKYLQDNNIPQSSFFEKVGVSQSTFRGKASESEFGGDSIAKILAIYPSISPDWLLLGIGTAERTTEDLKVRISGDVATGDNNLVAIASMISHVRDSKEGANVSTLTLQLLEQQFKEKEALLSSLKEAQETIRILSEQLARVSGCK